MADELVFRVWFIALYVLFVIPRVYYRFVRPRRDDVDAEVAEREAFGVVQAAMTIVILGFLVSSVLYLIGLPWMDWFQIAQYSVWLRSVGAVIALIMPLLLAWIHRELDRQYSAILEIKKDHRLITTGPYEKVRHPMYTVLTLFSLGISMVTGNALIILFAVLLMIGFPFWVRIEEEKMIETFGDEYIEYMKRTGRFLPRLSKPQERPSITETE
ncbi:MAG: isoprenylcysteine carboxylmethyltransferase family protein [Candidatus Thorarchaeota archaeon]|nr:MAG: isoprenylcysteine carboxylmethyltransferase family protein [Candidatus Thorarchaeota archaeon]